MPKITALIHASNDAQRIRRTLDSLAPCDEVLVIDHDSNDDTGKIARDHGAKVKAAIVGVEDGTYVVDASNDWILCLLSSEALAPDLQASLSEWKDRDPGSAVGFLMNVREQTGNNWSSHGLEMRLVNHKKINWTGTLPPNASKAPKLKGDVLRFKQ